MGVFGAANYEVVSFPYKQPVQFVGEPNNGDQFFTLDPVSGVKNLIGNPYPSALDANAFLLANQDKLEGTIYFWTHNTAIHKPRILPMVLQVLGFMPIPQMIMPLIIV